MKEKSLIIFFASFLFWNCATEADKPNSIAQFEWEVSTLADLNINQTLIDEAFTEANKLNYIISILVIRNGKIAAEKYFNEYNKYSENNIRSVSKSFLSAAIGIAVKNGVLSKEDKLTDIIKDYESQIVDVRFSDISVSHLLKMQSGLDRDYNIYTTVVNSANWLSTIFGMRLINDPGENFVYSTPATHLLSAALTNSSGKSSFDFVTENLLIPLGIELNNWSKDPQGIYFGGNSMYFTTRNMAALGLLYLNGGLWQGKQIVPKLWITESLIDHTSGTGSWGDMTNIGYGYLWWLGKINNYNMFTAIGHGGQFVLCVPKLNLIVATNAYSNIGWDEANSQEIAILGIISNYIIPAVNPF